MRSADDDAIRDPSGVKQHEYTTSVWPRMIFLLSAKTASQMRTVLSAEQLMLIPPAGFSFVKVG